MYSQSKYFLVILKKFIQISFSETFRLIPGFEYVYIDIVVKSPMISLFFSYVDNRFNIDQR